MRQRTTGLFGELGVEEPVEVTFEFMLVLLRIVFGLALVYEMVEGAKKAPGTGEAGDLTGAAYLAGCVILGILNALVWAPYLGAKVSGPLTGMLTGSTYVERTNWLLRWIRRCEARQWRRATVALCFWEAVRHPSAPSAYVAGFRSARPGSWLEKVFAREVFRFNNTRNCVEAYLALKRHGIDPRPHASQEVNIVLLSIERPPRPAAQNCACSSGPRASPLQRNPRIRLFKPPEGAPGAAGIAEQASGPWEPDREIHAPSDPANAEEPELEAERFGSGRSFARMMARITAFLRAH